MSSLEPATIAIDDFMRVEVRVGKILRAEVFPEARKPAFKLTIDFGPYGIKRSSAQVASLYTPLQLEGRLVVAVVNFPPRRIAGFSSEVLVLGVPDANEQVVLLQPDRDVPLGGRMY